MGLKDGEDETMLNDRQKRLTGLIDDNRQMILDTERFIWAHPETGYRE